MPKQPTQLDLSAHALHGAAPGEWERFVEDFAEYTREALEAVSSSPTEHILVAKGWALACKELLRHFRECDKLVQPQPPAPL